MKIIKIAKPFTLNDVSDINNKAMSERILLIADNTKGISKELINQLSSNVTISITGALNPEKNKFNNIDYQERTYYSPNELFLIISNFERIERNINPLWNDLEKSMYIYKVLCELFMYSENIFNNKDAARNLLGMITNQSVCSGFALIFKEAMDRINIPCIYQNRRGHHSWNCIMIDGQYSAIELTWDTFNKKNNVCGFNYFCRENKEEFYSNEHHMIDNETEEVKYPIQQISNEILSNALNKINKDKIYKKQLDDTKKAKIGDKEIEVIDNVPYINDSSMQNCTFIRNDETSFLVFPTGKQGKGVIEYIYIVYKANNNSIQATKIYSEMDLISSDPIMADKIKNDLMSEERIKNKVNSYNGYIGYVTLNSRTRYYNRQFEEDVINKYR